jgi:hypothetical protein
MPMYIVHTERRNPDEGQSGKLHGLENGPGPSSDM